MADVISVIVPVYNVATELQRCLDSILVQTYPHIEVVTVDDGSTDGSGDILDRYAEKHSNIRVIHKKNGGVMSARLRGIQEASGEWIGFVDGDDMIEPNMYERLLSNALKYDAQISHCGYQLCLPDGRVNYFHNTGLFTKQDRTTALRELLSGSMIEPGLCNKLFHKTLFHGFSHGKSVDISIKINEDLLMNFYLFSVAKQTVFEDWCPYHYIVRKGSASRAKLNEYMIYDPIRVKEIIRKIAADGIQSDAQKAYINTCINIYNVLLDAGKVYQEDMKKVRELLKIEKNDFSLLGRKRSAMAWMIVFTPTLYNTIYRFYMRYFKQDLYS